jgi:hypothetical protein
LIDTQPDAGVASGPVDDHLNVVGSGHVVPPSPLLVELALELELLFAPELLVPELPLEATPVDADAALDSPFEPEALPDEEPVLVPDPAVPEEVPVPGFFELGAPAPGDEHPARPPTRAGRTRVHGLRMTIVVALPTPVRHRFDARPVEIPVVRAHDVPPGGPWRIFRSGLSRRLLWRRPLAPKQSYRSTQRRHSSLASRGVIPVARANAASPVTSSILASRHAA